MNLSVHNLYTVIASESEAIQACKLTIDEWRCHGVQTSIVSVDVGRPGWSRHLESLDCFALARNDGNGVRARNDGIIKNITHGAIL